MSSDKMIIRFKGGMADEHKLPGFAASQSLAGLSRAILIPTAYLAEGKVRHRNVSGKAFELNLLALRRGSFETIFELNVDPAAMVLMGKFAYDLGKDVGIEFIKDFVYSIIKRSIGHSASASIEALEEGDKLPSGDAAALVEAIEPSMREAHLTVGNGATNVFIVNGSHNVITLNAATRAYVNDSFLDKKVREKDFSVGSFNANTNNGRAFDYDIGKTVGFTLDKTADARSIAAIVESLQLYARAKRTGAEINSRVSVKYTAVLSSDDRIKRMVVHWARKAKD